MLALILFQWDLNSVSVILPIPIGTVGRSQFGGRGHGISFGFVCNSRASHSVRLFYSHQISFAPLENSGNKTEEVRQAQNESANACQRFVSACWLPLTRWANYCNASCNHADETRKAHARRAPFLSDKSSARAVKVRRQRRRHPCQNTISRKFALQRADCRRLNERELVNNRLHHHITHTNTHTHRENYKVTATIIVIFQRVKI